MKRIFPKTRDFVTERQFFTLFFMFFKFSNFVNFWSWDLKFLQESDLVLKHTNPGSFFYPANFDTNFHRWFGKKYSKIRGLVGKFCDLAI